MTFPVSRRAAFGSLALAFLAPASFADTLALAPVLVTATRSAQPASEVLSDNVTLGPEEIARAGAGSLIDLLQRQRGIEVVRNGGAGASSSVLLRGANKQQNIVLVDGVRIGSASSGEANWSAIPLSAIDHVEIVYGALSSLYGADAIGGVIQIFTKRGAGAPHLSAAAGAGSYAGRTYDASVAGATEGEHSFSYALSVGKEKSAGFSAIKPGAKINPDDDGYDKESVTGQFALQLAKGQEIGLLLLQSRLDAHTDAGSSATFDARGLQKLENLALFSKNQILPNWRSQLQLAQSLDKSTSTDNTGKSQFDTTQTELSWQNDVQIGADLLQILFGHRKEDVLADPHPELTHERSTKSVAAAYSLKRGQHLANVSLRHDDNSQYGGKTTGGLGYGYRLSNALRASASYGTSFRAPTFNDLYYKFPTAPFGIAGNRPEQGRNAEAGLYFDDGTSQLSAVFYHNHVDDLLVNVSKADSAKYCPPGYASGCARNINAALMKGLSLSGRRQFGALGVSANLDLQDPRDETSGMLLIRRAKRHANLALEYGSGALKGGTELQLSGQRFDDVANSARLGGYGLLNLYATYQLAPDWSLLARWNNVANKDYELARTYATAGSNVFVGLRYGMK